jgi:60 kDa SS-A/Ro ribonucleoprotein
MPNTSLFRNEAGGSACAFPREHALTQFAVTGTFYGTYYASADTQLARVAELAAHSSPELVAKTAVYCRERGRMKDVPAFLVAHLATRDVALMSRVFPRVIDDGRMLRSFVQIVRSGVTGRKSFGSAPKRALRTWFQSRTPDAIFRQSIGQSPSMSDVIKMVRPPPRNDKGEADAVREALYGYLIGKSVDTTKLPPLAKAFDAFKHGAGPVPDVPFEMLTALPLTSEHWTQLATKMTITQLRMNLNTLLRHGVLADDAMVESIAQRLSDANAIKSARVMPYQFLAAWRAVDPKMPHAIVHALAIGLEHATSNVPSIEGRVVLCPDVSGSMHSPLTGDRGSATTEVRCVDVAALVTAAILRKNPDALVLPFTSEVISLPRPIDANASVAANAELLARLPSGGTACSAPLAWLNAREERADTVVFISDNQSWADFRAGRGTAMSEEWQKLRARNPLAKLVLIDLQPYDTTQVASGDDVLNVGGFSDAVFDVLSAFVHGSAAGDAWLRTIEGVSI